MFKNILNLAASVTIFGGFSYSYLYYKTNCNKREYEKVLESDTLRDASRLSNDTFGISWGFQADDIIMKKLDSGDILFIKYDCSECLSVEQYVYCFQKSMLNLDKQYDTIGITFRDEEGLKVIYNEFGVTKTINYTEMVSLPFLQQLMIQKGSQKQKGEIHKRLREMNNIQIKESQVQFANRVCRPSNIVSLKQLIKSQQQIHVRTETNKKLRSM